MSLIMLSGFTFIRNAIKYDFPIKECVESMLPLVDELVINVGKSEDGTEELIKKIALESGNGKIRIVNSVWDDSKVKDGLILSDQTNIALDACAGRWCLYLQADEAIHENEFRRIRSEIEKEDKTQNPVDGLTFEYFHFYGGYSMIQRPWNWYPSEIRVVRKDSGVRSFGDAQTFKNAEGSELKTRAIGAHIYHYGHARSPEVMEEKIKYFHRFWHGDDHGIKVAGAYKKDLKNLVWFWGTHPLVYRERVKAGFGWSLHPGDLYKADTPKIVIVTDAFTYHLADEIRQLLTAHKVRAEDIEVCASFMNWCKLVLRNFKKGRHAVLVDLCAEKRNTAMFPFFASDMMTGFKVRIAHAPKGRLSKFRQRFYSAISWGCHEKAALGFSLPETQYARQLVRWLGVDC